MFNWQFKWGFKREKFFKNIYRFGDICYYIGNDILYGRYSKSS